MIWGEFDGQPMPMAPQPDNRVLFFILLDVVLIIVIAVIGVRL